MSVPAKTTSGRRGSESSARTMQSECMPWRTLARVQLSPSSVLIMTPWPIVPTRMFPIFAMAHLLMSFEPLRVPAPATIRLSARLRDRGGQVSQSDTPKQLAWAQDLRGETRPCLDKCRFVRPDPNYNPGMPGELAGPPIGHRKGVLGVVSLLLLMLPLLVGAEPRIWAVTVLGSADDSRLLAVTEAIEYWNEQLASVN